MTENQYGGAAAASGSLARNVSAVTLVTEWVRRWRVLAASIMLGGLIGAYAATIGNDYVAVAAIAPLNAQQPASSRLLGLAASFGVNVGGMGEGQTIEFYAALAKSRDILRRVVTSSFDVSDTVTGGAENDNVTLIEWYGVADPEDPAAAERRAIKRLRRRLDVEFDAAAGIITVRVFDRSAAIAEAVNRRVLDLLDEFNVELRQSNAAAERAFGEDRLRDVGDSLRTAERHLEEFSATNRSIESSARLQVEFARLQRQVDFWQSVYTSLAQAVEQARLSEVRSTPIVQVVGAPEGSAEPARGFVFTVAAGLMLGGVLSAFWVLAVAIVRDDRQHYSDSYRELKKAVSEALPTRWLRRFKTTRE